MPVKLTNLVINRVDLVDKGDNPKANITLFKRKEEHTLGGDKQKSIAITGVESVDKFLSMFKGLFQKEGVKQGMTFNLSTFVKGLEVTQRATVEKRIEALSDSAKEAISKNMEYLDEEARSFTVLEQEVAKQELIAQIATLTAKVEELAKSDAKKGTKKGPRKQEEEGEEEEEEEEVDPAAEEEEEEEEEMRRMKRLPESVRKLLETSKKEAKEAMDLVKKLQDEKLDSEYIAKAKQFPTVITAPDQVGVVLKRIAIASKDDYQVIEAVLKVAEEMVSRNNVILKEFGVQGGDAAGGSWTKIEKKAQEYMKGDAKMTKEQAVAKVMRDEPKLYAEYQRENQI